MKNKHASTILYIFSGLFTSYFILLEVLGPSLISFCDVWLILAFLLFLGSRRVSRRGKENPYFFMQGDPTVLIVSVIAIFILVVFLCIAMMTKILTPTVNNGKIETEYVIVLGGGVKSDGTLGKGVQSRLASAKNYLSEHPKSRAIVTGGKLPLNKWTEAPILAKELSFLGVEEERIIQEGRAQDTIQNLCYSIGIIAEEKGISVDEALTLPVTLCTSSFHLARAERLAKRIGFTEVYGIPSKIPFYSFLNAYSREICAWTKLNLRIILTGKPNRTSAQSFL